MLLAGCACSVSWSTDPFPWLYHHGYEPEHLELIPPSVVGDSICPANWTGWGVDAVRKSAPEEHCLYIRSKVVVCCPPWRREPCKGRELVAICAVGTEKESR